MAVAGGARFLGDDRAVVADDTVEQRRLADVRAPDEGDDGNGHAASARGSPSCERTSMKSYDGYTGMCNCSRSVMNGSSSRKTPLSLMHSAGISARSRSVRSLKARLMSAPTSRPAVVVVGPNSEFSATMSSNEAPV